MALVAGVERSARVGRGTALSPPSGVFGERRRSGRIVVKRGEMHALGGCRERIRTRYPPITQHTVSERPPPYPAGKRFLTVADRNGAARVSKPFPDTLANF
jgi:hypothetical protein